ncbi:hypothetical protein GCM10017786_47710 [Amycolatopsis deserti]|uniref:Uncharacterized protein n=1 Tax=Amycolatopsis deserti TaxID=185696 RepID=A0ABQ3J9E3_9PSEU|nr:hypothetical protein [Amycolatopsis deserti]GHF08390.1 hypothetical protein GCM10017786_47710 [Amycolatopsis deserti]
MDREALADLLDQPTGACRAARLALRQGGDYQVWIDSRVPAHHLVSTYRRRLRSTERRGVATLDLRATVEALEQLGDEPVVGGYVEAADGAWAYIVFLRPGCAELIACTGVRQRQR